MQISEKTQKKREKREALFVKQNGLCHWCKGQMTLINKNGSVPKNFATFEHLKRQREGGTDADVVLACYKCNNKREHNVDTNSMPHIIDLWANFLAHEKLTPNRVEDTWAMELVRLCEALAAKARPKFKPYRERLLTRQILCETAMELGIDLASIKNKHNQKIIMGRGLLDIWNQVYERRFGSSYGTAGEWEATRRNVKTNL
jgi:hypothetical protein